MISTEKLKLAKRVLAGLNKSEYFSKCTDAWAEAYCNGREQGFLIGDWGSKLKFAFAENRNSDHVVVYVGELTQFRLGGNIPDETVYENRRLFETPEEAVDYIIETAAYANTSNRYKECS